MVKATVNDHFKQNKAKIFLFGLFTACVSLFAPLKSFQLKWLIDSTSKEEAFCYLGLVFVITFLSWMFERLSRRSFTKLACGAVEQVRNQVMERILHRPVAQYNREGDAAYLSLLTTDLRTLYDDYYMSIFNVVFWGGIMLCALGLYLYISPMLLAVILLITVPPLVLPRMMNERLKQTRDRFSSEMAMYTGQLKELLGGFDMDISSLSSEPAPAPAPEPAPAPAASSGDGGKMSQEEIERLMGGMGAAEPAPAPAASSGDGGKMSQEEIERLMGGMSTPAPAPTPAAPAQQPMQQPAMQAQPMQDMMPQQMPAGYPGVMPGMMPQQMPMQQPMYYQPDPKVVNAKPLSLPTLDLSKELGEEQAQNLELIMSVPLEVSVEIGRTRRKVEDVLTFSKGSLVVLDKLAGDQVDLFVNGLCVARGDVVVIDDNFGVRITEVLKQPGLMDLAKKL